MTGTIDKKTEGDGFQPNLVEMVKKDLSREHIFPTDYFPKIDKLKEIVRGQYGTTPTVGIEAIR